MEISGGQMMAGWVVLMAFGLLVVFQFIARAEKGLRVRRQPSVAPIPRARNSQGGFRNDA